MKIKKDYVLRQVADTHVVLPVGKATVRFNGMLTLNSTGVILWHMLESGTSAELMTEELVKKFDIAAEVARKDVYEFLATLEKADCLE